MAIRMSFFPCISSKIESLTFLKVADNDIYPALFILQKLKLACFYFFLKKHGIILGEATYKERFFYMAIYE